MRKSKSGLGSDLAKLGATSDEEIARQIAEDSDAPELTNDELAEAEIYQGDRFIRRVGRPKGSGKKELVTLRLDRDVLGHFRAGGPGWQTRLNDALRSMVAGSDARPREVLREQHAPGMRSGRSAQRSERRSEPKAAAMPRRPR